MKKSMTIFTAMIMTCIVLSGCGPKKPEYSGFLSDYSKLEAQSDVSYRYIAPGNPLDGYSKFIIDPVEIHFHSGSKTEGKLKEQDLKDIKNYMHSALVKAIGDGYDVVYRGGPGVARVRVAITDLKKSKIIQNILPIGKVAGTGIGGASLEAELVDTQTGEQIGSLVESQLGKRLSLGGYSTWGDAKVVMDGWAARFRKRIDEAHGR